jgi:hypothetical protein
LLDEIVGNDGETRILANIVVGIGFLAGGVILRQGVTVSGLNTAATIWATALYAYWMPNLQSHSGFGVDTANPDDITAIPFSQFGRTYNSTLWSNLLWDVNKSFRIGLEGTYRKTEYKDPMLTSRFPNEGYGLATQFQWAFGER